MMSSEEAFRIEYHLILPDSRKVQFQFSFERRTMLLDNPLLETLPEWTILEFRKCVHCPLSSNENSHCPLASRLFQVIEHFNKAMSYDTVQVEVITERRSIRKTTAAQDVLSAILGLVIPSSGCPHTGYFRPMARFHLPMADTDETIYRATSMYLLAQYFKMKKSQDYELDFAGLKKIYQNMQILNAAIADRLRAAAQTDASVNAIILLDMFAQALPFAIEDSLEEIEALFLQYFE